MILFPEPLHPAIVHFPIALLLVGALTAVVAVVVHRWHLPLFAAILLSLGALGAVAATVTGEEEEEKVERAIPSAEPLLEEHAEWGESARNAGLLAAVIAIGAATLASRPVIGRFLSVLTALSAIGAAYAVAQAGHFGGELVYRHGAGVTLGAAATGGVTPPSHAREIHGEEEHGED
jgi:uncharacterized membrane protein